MVIWRDWTLIPYARWRGAMWSPQFEPTRVLYWG